MMKTLLIPIVFFFSDTASAQHVFYGERRSESSETAIYFDKDGFPYPDYFISDSSMMKAYGSLFTWFQQHNEAFIELSARYGLFPETINQETIFRLRDSISAGIARDLNRKASDYRAIAFYIHGFRKSFVQQNNDVTSVEEFSLLKTDLLRYHKAEALEVSVYWDGTYDCCFSKNRKRNKELFRMYEQAGKHAKAVGLGFRSVLLQVAADSIQIVTHSLGAGVATYALLNINQTSGTTPSVEKDIRICLIAPAIDRHIFKAYYSRQPIGYPKRHSFDYRRSSDNYHLMVVYNEDDFVLKKKDPKIGLFGPGARRYGRTTLGCNKHGDAKKMKRYFSKHFPGSELVLNDKTIVGKCHSLRCYTKEDYLKEVSSFLWANN